MNTLRTNKHNKIIQQLKNKCIFYNFNILRSNIPRKKEDNASSRDLDREQALCCSMARQVRHHHSKRAKLLPRESHIQVDSLYKVSHVSLIVLMLTDWTDERKYQRHCKCTIPHYLNIDY